MGSSKAPPAKSGPAVRIRCRDEAHIARELRRRANSDSLFIPSQAPPDAGSTQEFLFYVPNGPEVSIEAAVLQSIPPAPGGDMPGMLVSFKGATADAADAPDDDGQAKRGEGRSRPSAANPGEGSPALDALEAEVAPDSLLVSMTAVERRDPIISDAAALIAGKAFVEAQRVLSQALEKRPSYRRARTWLLIAQAHQAEGWQDYDTAMARYRAALAVDHDHAVASRGLAQAAKRGASGPLSQPRLSIPARPSTRASRRARRSGKP